MALDTMEGVARGRQETVHWSPGSVAGNNGSILGAYTFMDAEMGVAAPGTAAGSFLTSYAGVPALTAPARVVSFSGWGQSRTYSALFDRLWMSGRITGTGATINSGDMPARSSNGEGYTLYCASRTIGDAPATLDVTVSYTNSAGVSGRTASLMYAMPSNAIGVMVPMLLQTGDTGIKSIESTTNTDITSSNGYQLVIARRIAKELPNVPADITSGTVLYPKRERGRLLTTITSILPTGTVLVPSHMGSAITGNISHWQATLAYG